MEAHSQSLEVAGLGLESKLYDLKVPNLADTEAPATCQVPDKYPVGTGLAQLWSLP